MDFYVAIPARYAATRLPGKPLLELAGRPLLAHVHERALESGATGVVIATDDERIYRAAEQFPAQVVMTADGHVSGSDRLAEVANWLRWNDDQVVVNLQGDEPLMPATLIRGVAADLIAHPDAAMATVCGPIREPEDENNPNVVKVVMDHAGYALYFSRATIPYQRDPGEVPLRYRHLGLYAYRVGALRRFTSLPSASLERTESLEQLRALQAGMKIHVLTVDTLPPPGVDTPEDLRRVAAYFNQ